MIKEVGLEGERRRFAKDLSGGQKRRLSVAISVLKNWVSFHSLLEIQTCYS